MAHFHTVSVSLERSAKLLCDLGDAGRLVLRRHEPANKEVFLNRKSHFVIFVRDVNRRAERLSLYLFIFLFS